MRISQKLNTVFLPSSAGHRFEIILMLLSVFGFLSMASIYLLFI